MLPLNSYILSSRSQQENSNTSKTSQRIELKRESNLKLVTFIQINPLIYAVVTKDGQCTKEIKRRILMERTAISKLKKKSNTKMLIKEEKANLTNIGFPPSPNIII